MRIVFAGTPAPAVPSLTALLRSRHDVVAVLTRPDAHAGRGRALLASPVAELARSRGIETLTPARPSEPAFLARLRQLAPDCCPVVAYGGLLGDDALTIPPRGWVNLHFSLLPAWRGAAPVQHAIMAGDDVTGASMFRLEAGLDTGPVYGVVTEPIRERDTAGELLDRLATAGVDLLIATLDGIQDGTVTVVPQAPAGVSLAPKVTVDDARVVWSAPAAVVDRRVRACTPAPGAWTTFRGRRVKLGPVRASSTVAPSRLPSTVAPGRPPSTVDSRPAPPGELSLENAGVIVGCGDGRVVLVGAVRPEGRRAMPAADWLRGQRLAAGERFE
ncbi:MAG: methionyl-tRNA formyltransferase [Mycobacteriales bacterium]